MSVHAGSILHVGGQSIIDRIQSAGLGDVQVPTEVIREVGNEQVVDKVPGDPDFTFTLESFDVSAELEALLTGKVSAGAGADPGNADAAGTLYRWDNAQFLNIASPWKDPSSGDAGNVIAGHLVPGFYPTRIRYRYGVTDNAVQEVELAGGSFYYAAYAPYEQYETGDGVITNFVVENPAIGHRKGGAGGTTFKRIFGVVVNGQLQTEGVDYTQAGALDALADATASITFAVAPPNGADIRFVYFTDEPIAYPQAQHPAAVTKPAAVRGRNICVYLGTGGARAKVGGVQAFELEATVDGEVEREFCNEEIVGRTVNGRDCNGSLTVRSKDAAAFFALLSKVTGVAATEVVGWLNQNSIPLEVAIQNPRNPAQVLKTLYVDDAIFQVPGTPARVNSPTDFVLRYESRSGVYSCYKGAKP